MKGNKSLWSFFLTLVLVVVVAGCGGKEHSNAKTEDFSEADRIAYEYIAAKVERDDDRLMSILSAEGLEYAETAHLLKPGEHLYPGNEQEMGKSYEIRRYDQFNTNDEIYYYVKYVFPNNELTPSITEYIKIIKTEGGLWKLASSVALSKEERKKIFVNGSDKEKGTVVHEYQE